MWSGQRWRGVERRQWTRGEEYCSWKSLRVTGMEKGEGGEEEEEMKKASYIHGEDG